MAKIGVMGGSGLYDIEGIKIKEKKKVSTPFGEPSDKLAVGKLEGKDVVFLPRHGKGHRINPTNVNYRANMYAMKKLGVERIISLSACGSLREELKPLDFVIPTQFVDRTNQARNYTFFDEGIVAHIAFAKPVCMDLAGAVNEAAKAVGVETHFGRTYINMEGPQFSTMAESNLYRSWGMDIIGMTNMTEARLAREAEMCYTTLAAITDYDCWFQSKETVSVDLIIENLNKNVANSKRVLKEAIRRIDPARSCECKDALKYALLTNPKAVSDKTKKKYKLLIGKYVK